MNFGIKFETYLYRGGAFYVYQAKIGEFSSLPEIRVKIKRLPIKTGSFEDFLKIII